MKKLNLNRWELENHELWIEKSHLSISENLLYTIEIRNFDNFFEKIEESMSIYIQAHLQLHEHSWIKCKKAKHKSLSKL